MALHILYTYNDLQKITGRTLPTLQKFIKDIENDDKEFFKIHTFKNGRFIKFDEEIRERVTKKFGYAIVQDNGDNEAFSRIAELKAINNDLQTELASLKNRISELQTANNALRKQVEQAESDRREADKRAGMALLALTQEQQTTKALLPAPRKKHFFGKHKDK